MIVQIVCGGGNDPYDRDDYMETRLKDRISSIGTIVSSLSQGSSESHQTAFPYNRPDRLRGGDDPLDRDDDMKTRLKITKDFQMLIAVPTYSKQRDETLHQQL